jgi:beta-galactosidase
VALQNRIVKEYDQDHPTCTNLIVQAYGVERGVDPWLYGEHIDVVGHDLYPINHLLKCPWLASFRLDLAHSWSVHSGNPLWLPEIESGPIGGWVLGPDHYTTAADIRRYDLEAIGHGGKMILYQGYREWDQLPMHWGALIDLDGEPTERYYAAKDINTMVLENHDLFAEAKPVSAEVAILYDQANATAVYGMDALEFMDRSLQGVYRAFWYEGVPVEFVTSKLLSQGAWSKYRMIVMPFMMLVSKACGKFLADFFDKGGTLIGFAKCAMLDERSWYWHQRPGAGLSEVFGLEEIRIRPEKNVAIKPSPDAELFKCVDGAIKGYWHRQDFVLLGGTEILARFSDGAQAVTRHQLGQGSAYYFGTHFDIATLLNDGAGHQQVWRNIFRIHDVRPSFKFEGDQLVDPHLLVKEDKHLCVLANHSS